MEYTDHIMLVGAGAKKFALEMGFKEQDLLTEQSRADWLRWKSKLNASDNWLDPVDGAPRRKLTRPALISSSALRREATPADASTFCSRMPSGPSASSTSSALVRSLGRWPDVVARVAFGRGFLGGFSGSDIVDPVDVGQQRPERWQLREI